MSRPHPECPHSDFADHLVYPDVLRQEPDEEEDEEEDEGNDQKHEDDGDEDESDDGYSERA